MTECTISSWQERCVDFSWFEGLPMGLIIRRISDDSMIQPIGQGEWQDISYPHKALDKCN